MDWCVALLRRKLNEGDPVEKKLKLIESSTGHGESRTTDADAIVDSSRASQDPEDGDQADRLLDSAQRLLAFWEGKGPSTQQKVRVTGLEALRGKT